MITGLAGMKALDCIVKKSALMGNSSFFYNLGQLVYFHCFVPVSYAQRCSGE